MAQPGARRRSLPVQQRASIAPWPSPAPAVPARPCCHSAPSLPPHTAPAPPHPPPNFAPLRPCRPLPPPRPSLPPPNPYLPALRAPLRPHEGRLRRGGRPSGRGPGRCGCWGWRPPDRAPLGEAQRRRLTIWQHVFLRRSPPRPHAAAHYSAGPRSTRLRRRRARERPFPAPPAPAAHAHRPPHTASPAPRSRPPRTRALPGTRPPRPPLPAAHAPSASTPTSARAHRAATPSPLRCACARGATSPSLSSCPLAHFLAALWSMRSVP